MFSSEHDGCLSFEDFLDMLSVFSRSAPVSLKTSYAFRLYGEDPVSFMNRCCARLVSDAINDYSHVNGQITTM